MEMTPDTIDFNSLSKKQLLELVIAKYNDCFRLEEENKKLREENKELIGDKMRKKKSDRVRDMLEDLAIGITMLFGLTILAETIAYLIIYHTDLFT